MSKFNINLWSFTYNFDIKNTYVHDCSQPDAATERVSREHLRRTERCDARVRRRHRPLYGGRDEFAGRLALRDSADQGGSRMEGGLCQSSNSSGGELRQRQATRSRRLTLRGLCE